MKKENIVETQIWRINGRMVVAQSVEEALVIWRAHFNGGEDMELRTVERVTSKVLGALIPQGAVPSADASAPEAHAVAAPMPAVSAIPADGVYPEEGGVRIWKNGHTFLVPKEWDKEEWPLLNEAGYERSKRSKERLMSEADALLDWDFVAATKHIQNLGTDIPLKEGEYMLTAPVWLAMYEHRDALNKALRAMGAKEIDFDKDVWFAQRANTYYAWYFVGAGRYLNHGNVSYSNQVVALSL